MNQALSEFFIADHLRLADLLVRATSNPPTIDVSEYAAFRCGLLRHIAMEEKVLLPFAKRARGGNAFPIAAQLRRQHAAIAALLVPTPTPLIVGRLRLVLAHHNALEEGTEGVYAASDALAGPNADRLLEELRAVPDVLVNPFTDAERALKSIDHHLRRIGLDGIVP